MFNNLSIQGLAVMLPALIVAFTVHELSHGLMAYILGDETAKRDGRLTLNPIRHIDPMGLICIILFQFGWAKPVMINTDNLKNPKVDMALIAFAGPLSNFVMGFFAMLAWVPLNFNTNLPGWAMSTLMQFSWINILLGVFNLLPIPPLDGSKVISGILPDAVFHAYNRLARYGMLILIIMMFTGVTSSIIFPIIEAIFYFFFGIALRLFL